MIVLDTNILLYAVNRASTHHEKAKDALEELARRGEPVALTWPIAYEFLRVATHPRVFPRPLSLDRALECLIGYLEWPEAKVLAETGEHLALMASCRAEVPRLRGNLLHDFHTAVLMREHGVKEILTLDQDFKAFLWVRIRALSGP